MNDRLIARWREAASTAAAWAPGEDPEPVLAALAMSLALELTGDLAALGPEERRRLASAGRRALLASGGPPPRAEAPDGGAVAPDSEERAPDGEEAREARRLAAALARGGLRVLGGEPPPAEPTTDLDARLTVAPRDLVRLRAGELDGVQAGLLAHRIRRSPGARRELAWIAAVGERPERRGEEAAGASSAERASPEAGDRLLLAATDTLADPAIDPWQEPARDPRGGASLGVHPEVPVEAVLFRDGDARRLAVYAAAPVTLSLRAAALTPRVERTGYWEGVVEGDVDEVDAELTVAGTPHRWRVVLPAVGEADEVD
ncbi:MAG: hypothetical protein ACFCGT_19275 [Sandaracinaceae bacterium]